jgi:hypothetical protein
MHPTALLAAWLQDSENRMHSSLEHRHHRVESVNVSGDADGLDWDPSRNLF